MGGAHPFLQRRNWRSRRRSASAVWFFWWSNANLLIPISTNSPIDPWQTKLPSVVHTLAPGASIITSPIATRTRGFYSSSIALRLATIMGAWGSTGLSDPFLDPRQLRGASRLSVSSRQAV